MTASEHDPLAGWRVTTRRILWQPAEAIFELVIDVERVAGLGPEHHKAGWLTGRRGTGARFYGMNRVGDFEWTVPCTVTGFIRPKLFSWSVGDPLERSSTWIYTLEPTLKTTDAFARGATTVTHTFQHGPGYSHIRRAVERDPDSVDRIVAERTRQLRQNMTSTLQQLELQLARRSGTRESD